MTPQDILAQINRPPTWVGWIPTISGGGFHPLEPKVEDVRPSDIVMGLSRKYRYGGHSDPGLTVAEHAVLTSRIVERLWGKEKATAALLHDACEAYTHDIQSPIRSNVFVRIPSGDLITWDEMDRRINLVVFERFSVPVGWLTCEEVKAADILAASFEQRDARNLAGNWGLPAIPDAVADLRLEFLNPVTARVVLLGRWHELGLPLSP